VIKNCAQTIIFRQKSMQKKIVLISLACLISCFLSAQEIKADDIQKSINDASAALKVKNYKETNLSLQQALSDLSVLAGKELLTSLPEMVLTYKADKTQDNVSNSGAAFGAGTSIERYYKNDDDSKNFKLQIVNNSPLLATLNMYITNPMYANSGDGQSVVKLGSRRGMLKLNEGSGELQLPMGQSLLNLTFNGIASKTDVTAFAEKLDIEKIVKLLGE